MTSPLHNTIPYYALRATVWPKTQRHRALWIAGVIGLVVFSAFTLLIVLATSLPLLAALVGALGVSLIVAFLSLFWLLLKRALDPASESELVRVCADEIGNQYADVVSLRSIRDSAAQSNTIISTRTPLPIVILTVLGTVMVAEGLDVTTRVLLVEFAGVILLYLLSTIIDGNADGIIQRALVEHTRRTSLLEQALLEQALLESGPTFVR